MLRTGTRGNEVRVIVPPMAGLEGGRLARAVSRLSASRRFNEPLVHHQPGRGWRRGQGGLLAKRDAYFGQRAAMGPAEDLAREVMEGRVRF